ncbi:hypothetical protein PENTCL1PPCAC_27090, partial [Pristionchus entomophagus]
GGHSSLVLRHLSSSLSHSSSSLPYPLTTTHTTMPTSPPGSSQSSTKRADGMKKRKKSWSLEGKNKKGQAKSRQQIKAMLLAKEKIKEEDLDAPPNSDAKDESLRIFEQQKFMPEKEEYVMKQPQIALKRKVKKGNRRAETVRVVRKNRSRSETPKMMHSCEETSGPVDTSLFKERASANNSNANSPDNSERQREREARRRALEERTQQDRSTDHSTPLDSEGDSTPLPLAREPEPEIETRRATLVQRSMVEKSTGASRIVKTKQEHHVKTTTTTQQKDPLATVRPSQPRTARSTMGPPTVSSVVAKPTGETTSTQLALEPEPDLDRVRRQKEATFMKRFLSALKLLPNTAPPRPISPAPRSEDSPSDSSKRHPRNYKHNMHHNMRKHPK